MSKLFVPSLALVIASAILAFAITVASVSAGGRPLSATLTGAAVVAGGDPDGSGSVALTLNSGLGQVCFEIEVADIDAATAAHIHKAPAGINGGVVLALDPPTSGSSSGCKDSDRDLVKDIRKNPSDYYVQVHNEPFPPGALRGQLSK